MLDPLLAHWIRVSRSVDRFATESEELRSGQPSKKTLIRLSEAAALGNPFAMCRLSGYYSNSESKSFSPEMAFMFAHQAAQLSFAPGHFLLGWCLERGIGTDTNMLLAREHFELSAESGYGVAALHLADALIDGRLGVTDSRRVVDLLSLAAAEGDSTCATRLGSWCEQGKYVDQNFEVARKWYELASDQGSSLASVRLAKAYANGELGVRRDRAKSLVYLEKSEQGDLS